MDVCGAPALTSRVVKRGAVAAEKGTVATEGPVVLVVGAAGKSGSLSAAAARQAGASKVIGVVPTEEEAALLRNPPRPHRTKAPAVCRRPVKIGRVGLVRRQTRRAPQSPLVDAIVIADARDPVGLAEKVEAAGGPADVTVVCVDVAGCEGGRSCRPSKAGP